ncbi:MAG: Crp/Fnr family transcriptional regulator [Pseudomonadota bacterium]|nr:Crp/Fnr family transcriptional regulator [Pseudomonadota bacterium]
MVEADLWAGFRDRFEEVGLAGGDTPDIDAWIWFPTSAVLGLNVFDSDGETIDVALAGLDAAIGTSPGLTQAMGPASARWIVRLGGTALRAAPDELDRLKAQSRPLAAALERYEAACMSDLLKAALSARVHLQERRLASVLLRLMDSAGRADLAISQETLAEMLGIQRTTLSAAASDLKRSRAIRYARGRIQVLDADGLRHCARETSLPSTVPSIEEPRVFGTRSRIPRGVRNARVMTLADRSNSSP